MKTPEVNYLFDHATSQRIAFFFDEKKMIDKKNFSEIFNLHHILEQLVISDNIIVMDYDRDDTQIETERVVELISGLKNSSNHSVIRRHNFSELKRLYIAETSAEETFDQLSLEGNIFNLNSNILKNIELLSGRPPKGRTSKDLSLISNFFEKINAKNISFKNAQEYALEKVKLFGTLAFLPYGITKNEYIYSRIKSEYTKNKLSPEYWERLNILFRAIYNRKVSEEYKLIYSPGFVRQEIVSITGNRIINHLNLKLFHLLKQYMFDINQDVPQQLSNQKYKSFPILPLLFTDTILKKQNIIDIISEIRNNDKITPLIRIINEFISTVNDNPTSKTFLEEENKINNLAFETYQKLNAKKEGDDKPFIQNNAKHKLFGLFTDLSENDFSGGLFYKINQEVDNNSNYFSTYFSNSIHTLAHSPLLREKIINLINNS